MRWARLASLVALAGALFWLARSVQETGHGWGDDFALYINQARGLTDGTADVVVADNNFALANSAYRFGPIAYPWGFPAMLAPMVMIAGVDYGALKLVGTVAFVAGALMFLLLLEPRLDVPQTILVAALIGLNGWYLSWTDAVLSDLPFWCCFTATLLAIDVLVRRRQIVNGHVVALTGVGLLAALAFSVRREGVVLLVALAAAQIAAVVCDPTLRESLRSRVRPLLTPYVSFIVAVAFVQFVRPAPVKSPEEHFGPTGLQNVRFNAEWYVDPLAEMVGLKDGGANPIEYAGSHTAGVVLLTLLVGSAVLGIVVAVFQDPRRDAHLAAGLLALSLAVLVQPFREGRYLFSAVPLIAYFAVRGLGWLAVGLVARTPTSDHAVRWFAPSVLVALLLSGVLVDTRSMVDYHWTYDYTHWGPEAPEALELFDAVVRLTDSRDVVVFYQARTMNLYTGRRAIQGNSVPMMRERGDWYAMTRDSDYIQTPLTDEEAAELGFVKVWENGSFVLWDIPPRPAPPPCCTGSSP
jgi:hypothetical protein